MKDWLIVIVATLAIGSLLLVGGNYSLRLGTVLSMYAVLAVSWNFIGGLAGYPSFATAAFFGLGAYASGILEGKGIPMPVAWGAGGLVAALFAGVIGLAILHLKGHYFAIASLALAEVLRELTNSIADLTGGGMGLNLPIPKWSAQQQAQFIFAVMLALAAVTTASAILVRRSKLGFGLRCIQQNEDAALMLGIDARFYKTAAFVLSAVFVGIAGAIYASWVHYIEPGDVFDIILAVKPMVMVLIGGLGTLFGPLLGAAAYLLLEEVVWRNLLTVHAAVLGLLIVLLVLFLPGGIAAVGRHLKARSA
jgi:branched-chain amino acid transport system permease protein